MKSRGGTIGGLVLVGVLLVAVLYFSSPRGQFEIGVWRIRLTIDDVERPWSGALEGSSGLRVLVRAHPELIDVAMDRMRDTGLQASERSTLYDIVRPSLPLDKSVEITKEFVQSGNWLMIESSVGALYGGLWRQMDSSQREEMLDAMRAAPKTNIIGVAGWDAGANLLEFIEEHESDLEADSPLEGRPLGEAEE